MTDADLLAEIPALDAAEVWHEDGFHNIAEWVSARVGNSVTQAWRWVRAARAMRDLTFIPAALRAGDLCVDKVLDLTRFATPQDEERLVRWAERSSVTSIRNRADRENRPRWRRPRTSMHVATCRGGVKTKAR